MPLQHDIDELTADPHFRSLVAEMTRRCIPWDEFLDNPQPNGISPTESWRLLIRLLDCSAVPINVPDLQGNTYTYRRTHELEELASGLACACRSGSQLHRSLTAVESQHFLVGSRVAETVAAAQLDGLAITEAEATVILRLDRPPQTPAERLLVNTFRALDQIPHLVHEPFSRELFAHLRDLLLDGVDVSSLPRQTPMVGTLAGVESPGDDETMLRYGDETADRVAAYLNGETADQDDLVVLRASIASDALRHYRPCGPVSSQVGRLAARLHALKNDLPVLGLLPLSRAKVAWERGLIGPPAVSFDQEAFVTLRRRAPFDATPSLTLSAQLMRLTLADLEQRIRAWERRDDEMRDILHQHPLLNQRQRLILARALRDPDVAFLIRYHQLNHDIHYTTARRDFTELHGMGFLTVEQRGKAFAFRPGPRLRELETARVDAGT